MKRKHLSLFLLVTLVASMFVVTGVALAQDPQPEATDATVDVTQTDQQVTVSETQTVTPTGTTTDTVDSGSQADQPTDTPTTEPTPVITATPTTEPSPVITTTPTTEPTPVITATPTTEPTPVITATPTTEPTPVITATPTTEPTPVITSTPTVTETTVVTETVVTTSTLETAGEIEASAEIGTWSTEYIGIYNLGNSQVDDVLFTLYDQSDGSTSSIPVTSIPSEGAEVVAPSTDGSYSGLIQSSSSLAVAAVTVNSQYKVGDGYLAFNGSDLSNSQTAPVIFKDHCGWKTKFHIQNAHSANQDITIAVIPAGSGSASDSKSYNLDPNNSKTVDITNGDFPNFPSGGCNNAYGYATITGNKGHVAVIVENIRDNGTLDNNFEATYRGFLDSQSASPGESLLMPLVFVDFSNWNSGGAIVNTESNTTTVTMTYDVADDPQNGANAGATYVYTKQLGPFEQWAYYFPSITQVPGVSAPNGAPPKSFGAISVSSSATKILASVTSNRNDKGKVIGYTGATFNPSNIPTMKAAVPLAFINYLNLNSGISVVPIGTDGEQSTVTFKWLKDGTDPNNTANYVEFTRNVDNNTLTSFYGPSVSEITTKFPTFIGSVKVSSDVPIIVTAQHSDFSIYYGSQIPGYGY